MNPSLTIKIFDLKQKVRRLTATICEEELLDLKAKIDDLIIDLKKPDIPKKDVEGRMKESLLRKVAITYIYKNNFNKPNKEIALIIRCSNGWVRDLYLMAKAKEKEGSEVWKNEKAAVLKEIEEGKLSLKNEVYEERDKMHKLHRAIVYYYREEKKLTFKEISTIIGYSICTTRSRYFEVKERKLLKDEKFVNYYEQIKIKLERGEAHGLLSKI